MIEISIGYMMNSALAPSREGVTVIIPQLHFIADMD